MKAEIFYGYYRHSKDNKYYEQLYIQKFDNRNEIDQFLKKHNLSKHIKRNK